MRIFGQHPRRGRSSEEHRGTLVYHSVHPFPPGPSVPPGALSGPKSALSSLKFTLSGLKSALSGFEFALSGLKSALSGMKSALSDSEPERADFKLERADFGPERADFRSERALGGRMDGRMNESPPVFYRTSSPSGQLPKRQISGLRGQIQNL